MSTWSYELETLEVEIEGRYYKGSPATRSWECPMGYPGDPSEIEIKHVWLVNKKTGVRYDIKDVLDDETLAEIEQQLLEEEDDK